MIRKDSLDVDDQEQSVMLQRQRVGKRRSGNLDKDVYREFASGYNQGLDVAVQL